MFETELKNFLKEKNITQQELANKIGVSVAEVNHWISGRRELKATDVMDICKALDITPNRFYGFNEISESDLQLLKAIKTVAANTQNENQAQNTPQQTPTQERER